MFYRADAREVWPRDELAARPGYGLYDRALGAAYLQGLWEAVSWASMADRPDAVAADTASE